MKKKRHFKSVQAWMLIFVMAAGSITGSNVGKASTPVATDTPTPDILNLYSNQNTLPILNIAIDESKGTIADMNNDPDHNTKCTGTMSFQIPDNYQPQYGTLGIQNGQKLEMEHIKGRGNSSWQYDKKPYKIKLKNKADLFGMGANKHWVLLANVADLTGIKNKMALDLAHNIGMKYVPQSVFIDVVMNGEYIGTYLLCEQVRVGKERINISDLDENTETQNATSNDIITGGYLINMESSIDYQVDNYFETDFRHRTYELVSPSFKNGVNEVQRNYIKNYMNDFETALYEEDYCNEKGQRYSEFLDVDSFVDYFLIQYFFCNFDAFSHSTYLYKERNAKACFGPIWDMDFSSIDLSKPDTSFIEYFYICERMLKDPEVVRKLVDRYKEIRKNITELYKDGGYIDQKAAELHISQNNDFSKWKNLYNEYEEDLRKRNQNGDYDNWKESDKEINRYQWRIDNLKKYAKARAEFMDTHFQTLLKDFKTVTFDGKNDTKKQQVYAQKDTTIDLSDVKNPTKKGYLFDGWYFKDGTDKVEFDKSEIVNKNMNIYADWKKVSVKQAKITKLNRTSTKKLHVCIQNISGAKGYEVVCSTSKKFTKNNTQKINTQTSTLTLSKLKNKGTYYVKARAYKLDSKGFKVYGKYSTVKKVTVDKK